MKYIFLLIIVLVLTGCGGGGSGSSSSSSTPPNTDNPSSSLLSENTAPVDARFNQYQNHYFELRPSEFNLAGNSLFLKVYLASGSVLFLGQIDKAATFSLPVSVPVQEKVLKYDLFSDYAGEKGISGEVVL